MIMKRNLLFAAAAVLAVTASAELPENLASQAKDNDAIAIFNAMDRFEEAIPDGFSSINYDAYPDGTKVIARRSDLPAVRNSAAETALINLFDSITAKPDARKIVVKDIDTHRSLRAYKLKDGDDMSIDLSAINGPGFMTSAAVERRENGDITIVQNWTFPTSGTYGAANLSALDKQIEKLRDTSGAITEKLQLAERVDCGGALRLRASVQQAEKTLDSNRLTIPDCSVFTWIDLHHSFMSYFGADANISLTYVRGPRMVTLVDLTRKKIYAARYRSTNDNAGTLTVLTADYTTADPFLPDNWATAR